MIAWAFVSSVLSSYFFPSEQLYRITGQVLVSSTLEYDIFHPCG
jgi:hypothetical protein